VNGAITILELFTFAGDNGQSFNTPWISVPTQHKTAIMIVEVKSRVGTSSVAVAAGGTIDTDTVDTPLASVTTGAQGMSVAQITPGLFPLFRVSLTAQANNTLVTLSIYLIPQVS
jgi:hypothetical protein